MKKTFQGAASETLAFRTDTWRKYQIAAAAARRDESPSAWLRRAVELALEEEWLALGRTAPQPGKDRGAVR